MYIQFFVFLLFSQSFFASQPAQEKAVPTAANIIYRSADGGQTWQDVSAGLPEKLEVRRIFAADRTVFLCSESGLYHSTNPPVARTWEKELLPVDRITDIFPGQAGPYICSYDNGFYQIIPGRGIWISMHDALTDKTVLAVLETPDGSLFVGCDNGIFKSADRGKSWKQVFADGLVANLVAADGVLVGTGSKGVLRSTNGGEHWDWALTEDGPFPKTGMIEGRFMAISRGAYSWQEANAALFSTTSRLRTSADGGKTWQRMNGPSQIAYDNDKGLLPVRVIYDLKKVGNYLFCSCDNGISRSSDQGKTWELMLPSTGNAFFDFTVSGQVIYAVKIFGGC